MTYLTRSDSNTLHLHWPLYLLHIAAVTNYTRFGGLEQYQLIILKFWRSEVQNQFCWARVKVLAGLVAQEALSGGSFPCLFKPVEATYSAWLKVPSSNHSNFLLLSSHLPLLTLISCLQSSYKEHSRLYQAHLDHRRWALLLKILDLITSSMALLLYKVTYSQLPGIRAIFWAVHYSGCHAHSVFFQEDFWINYLM